VVVVAGTVPVYMDAVPLELTSGTMQVPCRALIAFI
jgi:hypothetical protein